MPAFRRPQQGTCRRASDERPTAKPKDHEGHKDLKGFVVFVILVIFCVRPGPSCGYGSGGSS
jgi:hypothetical protein